MSEQDRAAKPSERPDPAVESPEESLPAAPVPEAAEEWPVRRALIRATLKLPEGAQAVQRQPPVFTMHQQPRDDGGGNQANGNLRNSRSAWGNGQPNKQNGKKKSSRSSRRNDRDGQFRNGSPSRSASSRRGRGRSR